MKLKPLKTFLFPILLGGFLSLLNCAGAGSDLAGSAATGTGSASGGESASFESGEPIDIPVPVAKVEKPINATRTQASYNTNSGSITISGSQGAMTGFQTGLAYDEDGQVLGNFTASVDGAFTLKLTQNAAGFGDPIALVVDLDSQVSPPIIVTMRDEEFYTVAITNRFSIDDKPLTFLPELGITYNGTNSSNLAGILYTEQTGGPVVLISDQVGSNLDQMQPCFNGDFLVGLNSSNQIVRVDISTGAVTLLSDTASASQTPTLRLSPNCNYVATTVSGSNSATYPVLEPTAISSSQQSDRIVINQTTTDEYRECDWIGNDILLCLKKSGANFETELLNLYAGLSASSRDFTTDTVGIRQTTNTIRNIRLDPLGAYYTFEVEENGIFELHFDDFTTESTLVDASAGHESLANSIWSLEGDFVFFDIMFETSEGDRSVIGNYELATGERNLLTVGTRPFSIEEAIFAYLCTDHMGENQVCVGNFGD